MFVLISLDPMHFDIPDPRPARWSASGRLLAVLARVAVLLVILHAPVAAQEIPLPSGQLSDTLARNIGTVRAGDLLALVVFQHPELSGTWPIDARGYANIPGIGSIKVAGLTPDELHGRFNSAMTPRILNPEFTVAVQIRVFVIGEVGRPGLHPVEPGTTLLQMLAIAGGPTPLADLRRTSVIRDARRFEVDLESGLAGSPAGAVTLFSNDQVVVDRKRGILTRENIAFALSGLGAVLSVLNIIISVRNSR
jgi:protein involved in polysaccharide export with SLBB domain